MDNWIQGEIESNFAVEQRKDNPNELVGSMPQGAVVGLALSGFGIVVCTKRSIVELDVVRGVHESIA